MSAAGTGLGPLVVARLGAVTLRSRHESDFPRDYEWRRDPELARFDARDPIALSFEEYRRSCERDLLYQSLDRGSYTIEVDGEQAGTVMFYNVSEARDAVEMGVMLGLETARGRGVGRTVTIAFLRYLWSNFPFRVVRVHCLDWNERARRSFAGVGFEEAARVYRKDPGDWMIRMEARREWWLLWDGEGRFDRFVVGPSDATS